MSGTITELWVTICYSSIQDLFIYNISLTHSRFEQGGFNAHPMGRNVTFTYTIKPISEPTYFNSEDGACMFLET
jgi:hypothetical protein